MSADKKAMLLKAPDWVRTATPTRANATGMQIPDLRAAFASVRAGEPAGSAAADLAGRSEVRSAKSA